MEESVETFGYAAHVAMLLEQLHVNEVGPFTIEELNEEVRKHAKTLLPMEGAKVLVESK